jgi:hypothetical protein
MPQNVDGLLYGDGKMLPPPFPSPQAGRRRGGVGCGRAKEGAEEHGGRGRDGRDVILDLGYYSVGEYASRRFAEVISNLFGMSSSAH